MLYFAYGSNLHHQQMKRRCKDSRFIKKIILKNYMLTFRGKYGAADIEKKKGNKVYGALYYISQTDTKRLDIYEEYPKEYTKMFFKFKSKFTFHTSILFGKNSNSRWALITIIFKYWCCYWFSGI